VVNILNLRYPYEVPVWRVALATLTVRTPKRILKKFRYTTGKGERCKVPPQEIASLLVIGCCCCTRTMAFPRSVPLFASSSKLLLIHRPHCVFTPAAARATTSSVVVTPARSKFSRLAWVRSVPPQRFQRDSLDQSCTVAPCMQFGDGATGERLLDAAGEPLLHVVFVNPSIHWNTGNMGRTALGLGARLHLVGPLGFSLDERQVRRAGLDYWHHVDLRVYSDWAEFSAPGGPMYAIGGDRLFFTKFGAEPAAEVEWASEQAVVLVFGSEINGFDNIAEWMEGEQGKDERRVAFPMVDDRFRSFNLSTSASMALWDAWKSLTASRKKFGTATSNAATSVVSISTTSATPAAAKGCSPTANL
jgi:tRNA (cytidine/uridine-2'-O-)-methyltransferase